MALRWRAALLLVLLAPNPAAGQEQRGSIEGLVRDLDGRALAGATVEARSQSLVGAAIVTTTSLGAYRFPALPPGIYELSASCPGFGPVKRPGVVLELGQMLTVPFTLAPADVVQHVEVRADSPLIDVRQNATDATIKAETIDAIPKTRDFAALVTFAPGIDAEARNRGLQIDGASGADNRFFIDGVDHTDLYLGTKLSVNSTGRTLAPDFIRQAQAKISGYSAEYRGAIGGVINAITKSGGNRWQAGASAYYTSDGLQGAVRPTLQLNPANQREAQYVTAPADTFTNWEYAVEGGGPLRRDQAWLYAAYNPQATSTSRTVTFRSNGQRATYSSRPVDRQVLYNLTGQLHASLRTRFSGAHERMRGGAALPNIQTDGTSLSNPALFPASTRLDTFKDAYSAVVDWIPGRTYVNVTTGYLVYGIHEVGTFSDQVRHVFVGSNFQFPEIPPDLQHVNGFNDAPSSSRVVRDTFARYNLNVDATRDATWHGRHTLKTGVQFERLANDVLTGDQAPTIMLVWDAPYSTLDGRSVRGRYGYYYATGFSTRGDVHAVNTSVFLQDSWTLNRHLTLNLGIRTEAEDLPSYRPENPGIHFGFADKVAPRVGFSWDPHANSQWKVYGSWGRFHDLMKLAAGRVMFGADHWDNDYYTLDSFVWPSIACDPANCPGTFIITFNNRGIANSASHNLVDPDLQPTTTQELTLGVDHELTKSMLVSARYAHKWADRVIEAVCDRSYTCGVNNPGFGTARYPFGPDLPVQPRAERVYDGAELRLRRRQANRWSFDTSYLWSRLWGNWSGINSSDEAVSCLQPNSCLAFDLLYYSYDASGRPSNGLLATDRPHRFKFLGTYDLPWGTQIGVNYLATSGRPLSTVARMRTDGINFFPYGRSDLGRTPPVSQTDVLLQQHIRLPSRLRLGLGLNVINLFDQMAPVNFVTTPYRDAFNISDQQFFSGFDPKAVAAATPAIRPDPRYRLASGYQARRSITVQAKLTF